MAKALDFLHSQKFVHRDIKPANILFREDNSAVLIDFGIARDSSIITRMTMVGYIIGTPQYMSPEQAKGDPTNASSDIYSLGILMYRMLAGHVPYSADDAFSTCNLHVHAKIPSLPRTYSRFDHIVKKAMAKSPKNRYRSAGEIISDLRVTGGISSRRSIRPR